MSEVLDILLAGTARNVQKEPETAEIEIPRLSKLCGAPVVFKLRGLTYSQVGELAGKEDMAAEIVLEGVVDPDLRDVRLAQKFGLLGQAEAWGEHGVLPMAAVTALLLPGEIDEISRAVQKLSGYLRQTTKAIKKN